MYFVDNIIEKSKRQFCDTYEGVYSNKVPKALRNLQRKLQSVVVQTLYVDHLQYCKCLYKAYIPCIRSICDAMGENDHKADPWYLTTMELMKGNQLSPKFIDHCCELKSTIKSSKKTMTIIILKLKKKYYSMIVTCIYQPYK